MNIDAHQHFEVHCHDHLDIFRMERWPVTTCRLNFSRTQPHDIMGSVAVQAWQTIEETEWLLDLAANYSNIRGVVGWVDLRSPSVSEDLEKFSQNDKFVGVRHVVQDEPDPRFLLGSDFLRGLRQLPAYNLTYDILIFPHQLPSACELVKLLPDQRFVLDHMAKPDIEHQALSDWKQHFNDLAEHENVVCKLSGLVTEANWKVWQQRDLRLILMLLEAFGPERLPMAVIGRSASSAEYAEVFV